MRRRRTRRPRGKRSRRGRRRSGRRERGEREDPQGEDHRRGGPAEDAAAAIAGGRGCDERGGDGGFFWGGGTEVGGGVSAPEGDVAEGGSARAGGGDPASGMMTTAYRGGWGWTARAFAGSSAAHLRRSGAGSARCGCGPFRRPCLRGGRRGAGRQGEGSGARRARDRAGDGASTNTPAGPPEEAVRNNDGIDRRARAREEARGRDAPAKRGFCSVDARSARVASASRCGRARGRTRAVVDPERPPPTGGKPQTAAQHPRRRSSRGKSTGRDSSARGGSFSSHTRGSSVFSSLPQRAARHRGASIAPARRLPPPREGGWEDLTQPSRASRGSVAPSLPARDGGRRLDGTRAPRGAAAHRRPRAPARARAGARASRARERAFARATTETSPPFRSRRSPPARLLPPPRAFHRPPPPPPRRPSSPETTPSLPPPPRSPRLVPPRPRSAR